MSIEKPVWVNRRPLCLQHDVVHKAEIFRYNEVRTEASGLVSFRLGDLVGNRSILAAVIFRVGDLPRAIDRAPDELELLPGGQSLRGHRHRRARRTVLRRDDQATDIAARWFTDRDLRAECLGMVGCGRSALWRERQRQ